MELSPIHQLLILGSLTFIAIMSVGSLAYQMYFLPKKRKAFLIKEMGHCLDTREAIYGAELINHCRTILHNIDIHCSMREGFKMVYTYGKYEIGVNWYPVNGLFEFTFPVKYETIAKIYYPT
jgi:hypothetical protein